MPHAVHVAQTGGEAAYPKGYGYSERKTCEGLSGDAGECSWL